MRPKLRLAIFVFSFFCMIFRIDPAEAQCTNRYRDTIYSSVDSFQNIAYTTSAGGVSGDTLLMDIYQPHGDTACLRHLVIWVHGGAFVSGTKNDGDISFLCNHFAQRGYVCADINYRLSKKNPLFHFDELLKSGYYAVQDAKLAISYFKENAARYHIDPDKIILAGNSAGGMIALQAAYSSNEELAKMAGLQDEPTALKCPHDRAKIAAVINLWGAIYDLNWLKNAKVPIICVLGSKDSVVPPTHKSAPLYGGIDIHYEANKLGIPNDLKVFDGYSHELQKHFNPIFPVGSGTEKRWLEAGQFAADFLFNTLYK